MKQKYLLTLIVIGSLVSTSIRGMEGEPWDERVQLQETFEKFVSEDQPIDIYDIEQAYGLLINFKEKYPNARIDSFLRQIYQLGIKKLYPQEDPYPALFQALAASLSIKTVRKIVALYKNDPIDYDHIKRAFSRILQVRFRDPEKEVLIIPSREEEKQLSEENSFD